MDDAGVDAASAAVIAAILAGDDEDAVVVDAGAPAASPTEPPVPIEGWWQRSTDVIEDVPELDVELERTFSEAAQPAELLLPLLPFQRESLTWMVAQE